MGEAVGKRRTDGGGEPVIRGASATRTQPSRVFGPPIVASLVLGVITAVSASIWAFEEE